MFPKLKILPYAYTMRIFINANVPINIDPL
jgi:hypothetical protein